MYRIRIKQEEVLTQGSMKYLGIILDQRWTFLEHVEYIDKKVSKVIRALSGLMPNLRGPKEKKCKLYANAVSSIINYGAPIWCEATNTRKISDILRRIQRVLAIRVISGYRTVSWCGTPLARIPPTPIHAYYFKRVFEWIYELKRLDEWSKKKEKEIRSDEKTLLHRQWQLYLQRERVAGKWTCEAILPAFDLWMNRCHGQLSFHMTQILTGHGCFYTYLYRIGKANTPTCPFCHAEDDSSEHTLQKCSAWDNEREELQSILGGDLRLTTIVGKICESEEDWSAFLQFTEGYVQKEEDERARERLLDTNSSDGNNW